MGAFEDEQRKWDVEVDTEAAELIRRGVPPYDAIEQARNNVSRRRRAQSLPRTYPFDSTFDAVQIT